MGACLCCEPPHKVTDRWHELAYCDACGAEAVLTDRWPNGWTVCEQCEQLEQL